MENYLQKILFYSMSLNGKASDKINIETGIVKKQNLYQLELLYKIMKK